MEKIEIIASILVFFELLRWIVINSLLRCIKFIRRSYLKLALSHNMAVMDFSKYIKEDLLQKAKIRELTAEEKSMFSKCHTVICKLEEEFKEIGIKPDVIS